MELTTIKINKFKSIAQPIEIVLNNGSHHITFIGKNGSGKTNILRALKLALSKNSMYEKKENIEVEYELALSAKEKRKCFECFSFDCDNDKILVTFNGSELNRKRLQAPIVSVSVKRFRNELQDILEQFRQACDTYLEELHFIESDETYSLASYTDVDVKNDKGQLYTLRKNQIDWIEDSLKRQIREIEQLLSNFAEDTLTIEQYDSHPLIGGFNYRVPFYEIADQKLTISPIVAQSLELNENDLVSANLKLNETIKRVNASLKDSYDLIQLQIARYEKTIKEIASIFSRKSDEQFYSDRSIFKKQNHFIQAMQDAVFANGYFIDNEDSMLFYDNEDYRKMQKQQANLNARNPIVEAFDIFLRESRIYKHDESIVQYDKIGRERLNELVKILNKRFIQTIIPDFDKQDNISYRLEIVENRLTLFVIEKGGNKVPFNETSLGRRWYLTYKLVSKLLKPGDYLFIDEPAAFLHPQAQLEIKRELETLSSQGVYVFVSTHSPYMISEDWANVISVSVGAKGTEIKRFESGDSLGKEIISELGDVRTSDILFNLSKTILLVEGAADKECIEKFAQILDYDLTNYHIHICDGDSILQVSYICIRNGIKFITVADNDNLYKGNRYVQSHLNYKKCIAEMKKHPDKVIFIGTGENGCLEDYFLKEEHKLHHYEAEQKKWKISCRAIRKITSTDGINKETLDNFEQLFIKMGLKKLRKPKS